MTAGIERSRRTGRSIDGGARRFRGRLRRPSERAIVVLAMPAMPLTTGWSVLAGGSLAAVVAVAVVVVASSLLLLSLRALLGLLAVAAGCLGLVLVSAVLGLPAGRLSESGVLLAAGTVLVGAVAALRARRRDRLGLRQVSAETVLAMIRDRAVVQARLPAVPSGWHVDIQQRPAHRAALSGDFVANRLVDEGHGQVLHLAVIDVAGRGIAAGPRALLLSGAVGGLLGSVPPEQFLAATNDYLARQQWSVGLASAIYLRLDLTTGEYRIRVAGHPPALHYRPGQASPWRTSAAAGTVLGVLPAPAGVQDCGVLQPGEALFLYTDGLVEDRGRDLEAGTRQLMDRVEALAGRRPDGAGLAGLLIEQLPGTVDDDRTLVVIQRQPASRPAGTGRPATPWQARQGHPAHGSPGHGLPGHGLPGQPAARATVPTGS